MKNSILLLFVVCLFISCSEEYKLKYPETKKVDVTDNYHGTIVADPYRWLEDNTSEETAKWVETQNKVTEEYLSTISFRNDIKERLTELWNYERYSMPEKVGKYYFFYKNDGLQEQSVVYKQEGLQGEAKVFIDPNKFSDDGSISLTGIYFSNDNKYCGYGISRGGSDWQEYYILDVETGEKLNDEILWVKFSGMSWYKDGFFYSRYDEPKSEDKLKAENEYHKVYYHKIGTPQSEDELIYEDKSNPKRNFYAGVTEDEKYLILYISDVSSTYNMLYYKSLETNEPIKPFINNFEANYSVVDNIDGKFLVLTDFETPNYKLVLIDPNNPAKEKWETIIPESENTISSVSFIGEKLFISYLKDATTKISVFDIKGQYKY
ncbi:MAG: S9 family peptidase, partial [Ignavibacteriales bacterium]|nr:S9 family peptidase [Ignavibacteriales bacterium]